MTYDEAVLAAAMLAIVESDALHYQPVPVPENAEEAARLWALADAMENDVADRVGVSAHETARRNAHAWIYGVTL